VKRNVSLAAAIALLAIIAALLPARSAETYVPANAAEEDAARDAIALARAVFDHPVQSAFTREITVAEIRRAPGHCPPGEPAADPPRDQYVVILHLRTFLAIPWKRVTVTCGGWKI
jgi:hypothetical protein